MGRLLSEEEFSQQFTDFEHSAWKLEVRDRYDVAEEAETIRRFLHTGDLGREEDHALTSPWHRNVTATTAQGKKWQRVRVVSEPLSDYITWEHAVTRFNIEAGEDIRWLPRHHPSVEKLPDLDFWLFDDTWACVLHFDDHDVPRELERIDDPDELTRYRHWRDIAWRYVIPHSHFAPEHHARFNSQVSHSIERARRDLGRRLREVRRSAGLTGVQLAELLSWSQPKVSKIETGRQPPTAAEITTWTRACGHVQVAGELIDKLNDLESMWVDQLRGGLGGIQSRMAVEEERVRLFRAYEPMIVPGLLQTPGYARAVLEAANRKNGVTCDIEEAVEQRMRRQEVLYRRGKRFRFLISEAAVRHRRGDRETMAAQLDRLITVSTLSTVSLGIIPFDLSPPYLPLHGFWIHDDDSVVVETVSAELTLTRQSEVQQYAHVFTMASSGARFQSQAREILRCAAENISK